MINERSPVIRRSPQHHDQYDRFYPNCNPNPNPKFLPKHYAFVEWTGSGEPMSAQPQFHHQQKDWVLNLASSDGGSFPSQLAPFPLALVSGAARGGTRIKSRTVEFPASSAVGAAAAMRDVHNRTKVVVRHLPPGLPESAFMEQIVRRFSSMYNMVSFCPGKSSSRGSSFSRAYIDFKHPKDVLGFHQGFNGHAFVNEKGTQYKALVEYAPNQRVPKLWLKKDSREGSIFQDPDYIKFIEQNSKPVESLPSAEVQLERKETERSLNSGAKEAIIVTPLMEFVRHNRALKSLPQKSLAVAGKISVRGGSSSMEIARKMVLKRGGDRSRTNSMYSPGPRQKEKATYVPRYEENKRQDVLADKKGRIVLDSKNIPEGLISKAGANNQGISTAKSVVHQVGVKGIVAGKKIVLGLDKEELTNGVASGNSDVSSVSKGGALIQRSCSYTLGEDASLKKTSQHTENGGQLSKEVDQQNDQDKHFSRSQVWKTGSREVHGSEIESNSSHLLTEDKNGASRQDGRRSRNKDRPDRPVWTVRQRGDSMDSPKNFTVGPFLSPSGGQRQGRGPRDCDNSTVPDGSKPPSKRLSSSAVYGGHEKQVWVAKPGSGS